MAVSKSSGFHTHSSWGRTRSPKNILSSHRAGISAIGASHAVITADNFSSECITENQRFLHITHNAAAGGTLEVWGYMHASGTWGKIGASITTANSDIHSVVEIFGVDKIKVKAIGQQLDTLWLACSTF